MKDLNAFYFTYGSDPCFPYQGGWTLVLAAGYDDAVAAFDAYHPRSESAYGCINCADIYTSEEFLSTKMATQGNRGAGCHEIIKLSRIELQEKEAVNE